MIQVKWIGEYVLCNKYVINVYYYYVSILDFRFLYIVFMNF